ncbi:MAG: TatD family hydrolase [Firmicutes bacterium]|nr:TatD family hydrolase [Bacillota bacterium]
MEKLRLFDSHCHLDDQKLYGDLEDVLQRAAEAGVERITNIGCDWPSSLMSVRLAERYPGRIYAAVGVHPHDADSLDAKMLERLKELAQLPQVVAWGEIGLDYHYDFSPRDVQKKVFIEQLAAAKQVKLPVIIHSREANQDTMDILKAEKAGMYGGVLHCFSGSWDMAKHCLDLGFYISFAGPLTFANANTPVEVASKVPLDRLLVETDSPYLSPHPLRGKTNEPGHVLHVAEKLAEIRGMTLEEIAEQTTQNAFALFHHK